MIILKCERRTIFAPPPGFVGEKKDYQNTKNRKILFKKMHRKTIKIFIRKEGRKENIKAKELSFCHK